MICVTIDLHCEIVGSFYPVPCTLSNKPRKLLLSSNLALTSFLPLEGILVVITMAGMRSGKAI